MITSQCPCCSGRTLEECCGPILNGHKEASTPEALMRSRYSAFVQKNADYLLATLAPQSHKPNEREALQATLQTTQWLGLKILHSSDNNPEGEVEFVAFYEETNHNAPFAAGKQPEQLHEHSRFAYIGQPTGKWYYTQGEMRPPIKLNRNEPCFCGSGAKYKKCCAA